MITPRRTLAALLAALAVAAPATGAAAAPTPTPSSSATKPAARPPTPKQLTTWAVQPSTAKGPDKRSTFTWAGLKPGAVVHDYVGISNFSSHPATFQVYATDAFVTRDGHLDMLAADKRPVDVGSWLHFAHRVVTVPAHARVNEPFTLIVPTNATPGDHTGGVLGARSQKGSSVIVDRRIGVPIYLRVAGPLRPVLSIESTQTSYHGTLNPFAGGGTNVTYTVHNTGNVRLTGTQTVSVTGPFGITLASAHPAQLLQLLPGASVRVTTHLSGVFPAGPLTVHVRIRPAAVTGLSHPGPALPTMSHSVGMWAFPWPQLVLLVLLVVAGVGTWWLLRERRRRHAAAIAAAVDQGRREAGGFGPEPVAGP